MCCVLDALEAAVTGTVWNSFQQVCLKAAAWNGLEWSCSPQSCQPKLSEALRMLLELWHIVMLCKHLMMVRQPAPVIPQGLAQTVTTCQAAGACKAIGQSVVDPSCTHT